MNIKFSPKYWFADKLTKFNLLLDQKYPNDCLEKEMAKLDNDFPTNSEKELDSYKLRKNEIEYKYDKIDEFQFEENKIEITYKQGKDKELALLENKFKFHKIKEIDYMKDKATIEGKPFVAVKPNFEEVDGEDFYLELEYNEIFLEKLKKQGYSGLTNEDIVEQWLKFKMIDSFDNLAEMAQNQIPTQINKIDLGDGKKIYK